MSDGAVHADWYEARKGWKKIEGEVIEEALVSIYVNGGELATLMCTPFEQEALAIGFLRNEGFIETMDSIDHIKISANGCCADVWLKHSITQPERKIITSGCGGGVTFQDPEVRIEPLDDELRVDSNRLYEWFRELQDRGSLYARARGVHAAGLSDGGKVLVTAEDVGRHNTIDKLVGLCMQDGIQIRGQILIVTGRISSEMLLKAAGLGCPVIASRNSPTSLSVSLAEATGITLIGYVRRSSMRVYTHPQRLQQADEAQGIVAV